MTGAKAPGKLILSGEHAAVYGRPALAMAVNCFAEATLEPTQDAGIAFDVPGLDYHLVYGWDDLAALHENRMHAYCQFVDGTLAIQEVLPKPVELIPFAFSLVWLAAGKPDLDQLRMKLEFGIPLGCGMGSSAAAGLCVIHAAAEHYNLTLADNKMFEFSLQSERLMHGHPSGVDTYVSLHGGVAHFAAGKVQARTVPTWNFTLLNSGRPQCSTGECVETVRSEFLESAIWDEFSAVTERIDEHLERDLDADLIEMIRENHRLLCRIGVVPERIQALVTEIETQGGAAKICGAGAVRGPNAGVLLAVGDVNLEPICQTFDVRRVLCRPEPGGTRCLE